jgi:two-component system chemotaxis response regulator CheY
MSMCMSPANKTIVHADDSASVRRWVAEQLAELNCKVVSVPDGESALRLLRESPCDLLLTDLEMPNLDGLSLVAAVRELPAHRFLPVLVLSCRHPSEFDANRRQGVTGWMVKPIDSEHLRRWVRRVLPD